METIWTCLLSFGIGFGSGILAANFKQVNEDFLETKNAIKKSLDALHIKIDRVGRLVSMPTSSIPMPAQTPVSGVTVASAPAQDATTTTTTPS